METLQKSAGFQPHPSAACGTGCFLQVPNKSKRALGFFFSPLLSSTGYLLVFITLLGSGDGFDGVFPPRALVGN